MGDPASLFEITNDPAADDGRGAASPDVSLVSGYNVPIKLDSPGPSKGPNCFSTSCVTDLNTVCPTLLQTIEAPSGSSGAVGCGGKFCQIGVCGACPSWANSSSCLAGKTCIIGCDRADKVCATDSPATIPLKCKTKIPDKTTPPTFTADGSTYNDMYLNNNDSLNVNPAHKGVAMFSPLQGSPICWGSADCLPTEQCVMGANTGISGWPSTVGLCMSGPGGSVKASAKCSVEADVGNGCGGYPNSGVYTCVKANTSGPDSAGVACVPAFNPPTVGIGNFNSSSNLFSGIAGPINPEWVAAYTLAGSGTPQYQAFTEACPYQYAWQYDDHAGGIGCNA